jgi:ribonuclease HII
MPSKLLRHERAAWATGAVLIGIDEVGRGPLAGPVVAGAVCFPIKHRGIDGVRDSKLVKLSSLRLDLALQIRAEALGWGLGAASVKEIERYNIRRATALAMRRAIRRCRAMLPAGTRAVVVVDGHEVPELDEPHVGLVKGDLACHAIASASIIAKVARDRLMWALAARRPGYGWESNVGYATAEHTAALRALGLTPHHRLVFCRTALGQHELFGGAEPA